MKGICETYFRLTVLVLFSVLVAHSSYAQGYAVDATQAAAIAANAAIGKRAHKTLLTATAAELVALKAEESFIDQTQKIERRYQEYIDSIRDYLVYAAQTWGMYKDGEYLVNGFIALYKELVSEGNAGNTLSLACSQNRGGIYKDVALTAAGIINDFHDLFGHKLSQQERIQLCFSVRPKLRELAHKLHQLAFAIRTTTWQTVWREISRTYKYKREPTSSIAERRYNFWRDNAKDIVVKKDHKKDKTEGIDPVNGGSLTPGFNRLH